MTTAEKALLLAEHVHVIANREDAGRFRSDILRLVERIEASINRPRPKKFCGKCPTPLDDDQRRKIVEAGEKDRESCATYLYAEKPEDRTVQCWKCRIEYVIEDLIQAGLVSAKGWLWEEREALEIMAQIGKHIPRGTWWTWKQRGVIINKNEWGAEPRYLLEDIIVAYDERVGKRKAVS